jgi:hypothetical protein
MADVFFLLSNVGVFCFLHDAKQKCKREKKEGPSKTSPSRAAR